MAEGRARTHVAYDILRERIVRAEYLPGARLPAAELAEDLGMSRTPIREALLLLEREGLVTHDRHRGAKVRPLDAEGLARLYDLRALLEGFAARKAAEAIDSVDPCEIDALWEAIERNQFLVEQPDLYAAENIEALMEANTCIHEFFARASGYPRLGDLVAQSTDRGVIYRAFYLFARGDLHRANDFHRMIAERVCDGDAERAASLMSEHVFQSRDLILAHLDAADGDVAAVFALPAGAGLPDVGAAPGARRTARGR